MLARGNVTVFEVVNPIRKELFVGLTTLPMNALIAHHRAAPPKALWEWQEADRIEYRSLEFGMTAAAAVEFLRGYVSSFRRDGWRVVTDEIPA